MAGINPKVGVIGAGTMGAGIAAHVANAGVPVVLLDIVPTGANNRNALAEGAVAKLRKAEPAAFMHDGAAKLIDAGNLEDDLGKLADCDWIVEAVLERIDIKQALYRKLEGVRRPGSAISSNTSTIALKVLTEGMREALPPRLPDHPFLQSAALYAPAGDRRRPDTAPDTVDGGRRVRRCRLGKSIVRCEDSPGFIANRLGIYWMQVALIEAFDQGLTVEEADAVIGQPMGIPKTGVFGLMDLVGIDLGPHVNASMRAVLPKSDAFHTMDRDVPLIGRMIEQGLTGREGKGGFYRLDRSGGGSTKKAIDLSPGISAGTEARFAGNRGGRARSADSAVGTRQNRHAMRSACWRQTIAYAATLIPEAAASIADIDEAMRLGYNWKWGPFELADKLGSAWLVEQLTARRHDRPGSAPDDAAGSRSTGWRVASVNTSARTAPITTSSAPPACCCWRISSSRQASVEERFGGVVGYRRRCRLLRVHLEVQRAG